jgi:hypothetical protein
MSARIPVSFAAMVLLALPSAAGAGILRAGGPVLGPNGNDDQQSLGAGPQDDQGAGNGVSDAQAFALVAGQILGAASACEQINEDRVSSATQKAVKITKDSAETQEDIEAAQQYMLDAADSARDAVKNGNADCNRVATSFTRLEQIEQNSTQQQSQLDDPDNPSGDQDQDDQQ